MSLRLALVSDIHGNLAALQAGWYVTPINWHFTAPEIAHIVRDSEARAFFVHERLGPADLGARLPITVRRIMTTVRTLQR